MTRAELATAAAALAPGTAFLLWWAHRPRPAGQQRCGECLGEGRVPYRLSMLKPGGGTTDEPMIATCGQCGGTGIEPDHDRTG